MDLWAFPKIPMIGPWLKLVPFEPEHLPALANAILEPGTWFYESRGINTIEALARWAQRNFDARQKGERIPWVMVLPESGQIVGTTCFITPKQDFRQLEIGGTWIGLRWQRTFVNTAVKHLMMSHCFEALHCARVSFKVDSTNLRSQQAVTRLGAQFEGVLRHDWVLDEGRDRRNVHVYSILEAEWPAIKAELEAKLTRHRGPAHATEHAQPRA